MTTNDLATGVQQFLHPVFNATELGVFTDWLEEKYGTQGAELAAVLRQPHVPLIWRELYLILRDADALAVAVKHAGALNLTLPYAQGPTDAS